MAGSLSKTIHFCDLLQSDEDSFKLIELMILCTNFLTMVRDLENSKTFQLLQKDFMRMHPNRGGFMMHMQRLQRSKRLFLSYENEVFQSVFVSRTSDIEDSPVNDRYAEGMYVVPPPMIRIYIPSGPDKEIDDSQFTYGLKQSKPSESDARSSDFNSCESNNSEETHESMPVPVVNEPKVVSEPKVWSTAPIIEEYESDSEDEHVSTHERTGNTYQTVPINAARKVNTVKPIVNNPRPKSGFHKSVSPFRKSFNRTTALRTKFSKQKVNIAEDYPQRTLQNKGIVNSRCSRHMTGNKAYLAEYQDFNGGLVAFGGSKGYITGK
ncbi:hypothetical protein Tco_0890992, partial [Tanacetum coccineum]